MTLLILTLMNTGNIYSISIFDSCLRLLNPARKITLIVIKFEINEVEIKMLEKSIKNFYETLRDTGFKVFPKLHYFVHLPIAIKK